METRRERSSPTGRTRRRAVQRPNTTRAQRDAWIESALPVVTYHARRYSGNGVSYDELCAEGHVGLVEAALRFDPSMNFSFSTYAVWWVRKRMVDALFRLRQTVQVPMHRLRRERKRGQPNAARVRVVSLDETGSGSERSHGEKLADPQESPLTTVLIRERREQVRDYVERLPRKEREILTRRFGLDGSDALSLRQLSSRLGISRERIRQIEQRCFEHMRRDLHQGTRQAEAAG